MKTKELIESRRLDAEQKKVVRQCFDLMNDELFDGRLTECIITHMCGDPRAYGHFQAYAYVAKTDKKEKATVIPEIFLNVTHFDRDDKNVLSTLLHEMCHHEQYMDGKQSPGYHNKDFAVRMKKVGLICSNTGQPGGKSTGSQMTHYVEEGGPFDMLYQKKLKKYVLRYQSVSLGALTKTDIKKLGKVGIEIKKTIEKKKKRADGKKKLVYKCECSTIYGKEGLKIKCLSCDTEFKTKEEG